jgi:hypothetical protein
VVTTALREYLAQTTVTEEATNLLDKPADSQPAAVAAENRTGARVDEVVFLYCI